MAEAATSRSVRASSLEAAPALAPGRTKLCDGAVLQVLPPRSLVRLQLSLSGMTAAADVSIGDTPLPTAPGHCSGDDPAMLWLAPDSWLVTSARLGGPQLAALVRHAVRGRTAAAVDVSDALVTFLLEGPRVRDLLLRGTGLDCDDVAFGPGRCTRTRFAQLPVILRPLARDRIELMVDRGPAAWLQDWFVDAGGLL